MRVEDEPDRVLLAADGQGVDLEAGPVARAIWRPRPDLRTGAAAWIYAGGSHHTSLGFSVTAQHLRDFAAMSGVELLVIDEKTTLDGFRDQLRWNDLYWLLAKGL